MSLGLLPTPTVQICKAAKAVFNVAPGNFYLTQYLEYDKANGTAKTVDAIANQAGGTDAAFSATVLTNLGLAGDAAGQAFLESTIASSGRGAALEAAFNFLSTVPATNATYGTPALIFSSAVTKSVVFSADVANNTTDIATLTAAVTVETDASGAPAPAVATGLILSLTTATDTGAKFVGGSGADLFAGVVAADGGTGTTAQPGDSINGGDGIDTLTISTSGANTAAHTLSALSTTGVEKVFASAFETSANLSTIDAALMTGVTHFGLSSSGTAGHLTISNVKALAEGEMRNGAANLTLAYNTAVVEGTADTQNLTLSAITAGTFTVDGIETFNVKSEISKSTLTELLTASGAGADMTKVVVTGDQDLAITNMLDFAAGTNGDTIIDATVDASGFSGKLTTKMDVNDLSYTGSTGVDVVDMVATLTKFDKIDTGDGIDQVKANGLGTAFKVTDFTLTNVETLTVEATAGNNPGIDMDGATITTIDVVENDTDATALTISNLSSAHTVKLSSNVTGINSAVGATDLTFKDAGGEADVLNLNVSGTSGHGSTDGNDIVSITFSDIEALNIESGKLGSTAFTTSDANVITSLVTGASTKTITITGDEDLQFTGDSTNSGLTKLDASAFTGKLTATLAGVSDVVATGGSKDDTLSMGTTLTSADIIDLAAGSKDTVNATVGATTAAAGKFALSNVETFAVTHTTTTTSNIDLSGATGLTTMSLVSNTNNGTGTINVTGMGSEIVTLANGNNLDTTISLALADATGTADNVTLNLADETNGANGTDVTLTVAADVETTTVTVEKFKVDGTTANVGDNDLNVDGVKSAQITITGGNTGTDMDLTEGSKTLSTTTTTLDASAFIGTLTATASANVATVISASGKQIQTITGSSKNDTITVGSTAATHVIDAGAGTGDVLNITFNADTIVNTIDNFETINLTVAPSTSPDLTAAATKFYNDSDLKTLNILGGNSLSDLTMIADGVDSTSGLTKVDASAFNGKITDFLFDADQLTDTVTVIGAKGKDLIRGVYDTAATYKPTISGVETVGVDLNANATVVFDLSKTTDVGTVRVTNGGQDAIEISKIIDQTIDIREMIAHASTDVKMTLADATGKSDVLNIKFGAADISAIGELVTSDIETINMNVDNAFTVGTDEMLMTEAAGETAGSNKLSIIVTGDSALTMATIGIDTSVVDASANSGGLIISAASSTATTITGSTVADVLLGGAGDDVIIGGSGNDEITGAAGSDTLTGGSGSDDFNLVKNESNKLIFDTITDLGSGDEIDMVGIVSTDVGAAALGAKASLSAMATFNDYLDLAANQDADGSANGKKPIVEWFQFNGNTYLTIDNTAATVFTAATDAVVGITGLVDLKSSTITLTATGNKIEVDYVAV